MTGHSSACIRRMACCLAAAGAMHGWAPSAAQGPGIYTCVDAKGRRLTSDRPIPECIDREQRELSPSGALRRTIGPTLTAQEQLALEAKARAAQEEINRQAEARRRDRALLSRYPNKAAHDRVRAESLVQIDEVIRSSQGHLVALREQRKKLDQEMEFYRDNPSRAPASLRRQFEENDATVAGQQQFIRDQETEKNRLNGRFDVELDKLKALWPDATSTPR